MRWRSRNCRVASAWATPGQQEPRCHGRPFPPHWAPVDNPRHRRGEPMAAPRDQAHRVPARLGVGDAVSIIIGIVIGAGIFETPPLILNNVSGPGMALAVWALAGLLSLLGALCYAELATTYPRSGGDYVYLTRAYGPWVGFLFGWAQLAVILTANIGMMAYVFAQYAVKLWDGRPGTEWAWAA